MVEPQAPRGRDERKNSGVAVWSLLLRVHAALVPQLNRELEIKQRLPLTWYDVLLELNAAPRRRLRMQELGNRVVLSRSQASRVVDELVRNGLVCREPDPADRRSSYATLTDAGRAALRSAAPVYLAGIAGRVTDHLTDDELRVMHAALTRVLAAADGETPLGGVVDGGVVDGGALGSATSHSPCAPADREVDSR